MTHKKTSLFFLILALVMAACARSGEESLSYAPAEQPAAAPADFDFAVTAEEAIVGGEGDIAFTGSSVDDISTTANLPQTETQERLIIRTGDLSVVVEDTEDALAAITRMVEENGGWVVSSNVYQYSDNAKTGNITVRVPSSGFNSAVDAIKGIALEVTSESMSGQDVTEEYVDLSSRLGNLEATADRVRAFLDDAKTVEEALAVNVELSRLEGDIEVIKGRMKYLSQSAAFSTITVNLTPDILSQPIEIGGWRPEGIARDAVEALVETLQGIASFLIWLGIYLLPLILIFGIPLWLIIRFVRGRRRRRRAEATVNPAE